MRFMGSVPGWIRPLVLALAMVAGASAPQAGEGDEVDVALILAVDISYSMDVEEQKLQKEGYIEALNSPEVLRAIRMGMTGKIAIAYFEWANSDDQRMVLPWTIIDGPESARAATSRIAASPLSRARRTSISGALGYARKMFEDLPFRPLRRVLDVSGDGPNNSGEPVERARNALLKDKVVINGLPIMIKRDYRGWGDIDNLDQYYQDCVIGGPGSFMLSIRTLDQFQSATRQKIIREVAEAGMADVEFVQQRRAKTDCMIGERMWRDRQFN